VSKRTVNCLAKLAKATRSLEEKRELTLKLEMLLRNIGETGQVVIGETKLLNEIQDTLKKATEVRDALEQTYNEKKAIDQLSKLEEYLLDVAWELAETIVNDFSENEKTQQKLLHDFEEKISNVEGQVKDFSEQVNSATIAQAPVMEETREARRLQGLVELAKRNLRERKLDELAESISQLEKGSGNLQQLTAQLLERINRTAKFARQADLLLLQSPLVEQSYQYTVLLRTPSEPGTHGINIQAESTLVEEDRKYMRTIIDHITNAINKGLARQFSQEIKKTSPKPEIDKQVRNLQAVDVNNEYSAPQNINDLIQDVGDLMYRLFMPERMQEYLNNTPCSITITTNDLELPWELMCYKNSFLCLERPIARLPMGETFPRRETQPVGTSGKLRFLLIYSDTDPPTLPAAEAEIDWIKDGLEKNWKEQVEIDVLKREQVKGHELNKLLRGGTYDVIHYAGHARFDQNKPELSGLLLTDKEVFFAQKIRRLLEGRPLVFLNACESGRCANEQKPQEIKQYLLKESAEGLSKAVIYGGALCCIGALWPIYDRPAAEFALQFYERVLAGYKVGEAMQESRIQSKEAYPNQITWAAFVLYGDPTYRLVTKY
jgi:hypothetical protein